MRLLENYMVFIICAMAAITLATCNNDDYEQFYNDMLKLHNDARKKHGAKYLVWNYSAMKNTRNHLRSIINGEIKPTHNNEFYYTYILEDAEQVTAKTIFDFWYKKSESYDYTNKSYDINAKYFTQIVWKNTRSVGFAFAYENRTNYFAAMYVPKGNIPNFYEKNVERPISEDN